MHLQDIKDTVDVLGHVATIAAAAAAAFWFLFTASFRKRVNFDIECSAFSDPADDREKFVELKFVLQNMGQVEQHCYTLAYELQSVEAGRREGEPSFLERSGNIVKSEAEYYYVRAGVVQRVTAHVWLPSDISIIRVKAFMLYDERRHEIRKDTDLFAQMYPFVDWIAADRVFRLS